MKFMMKCREIRLRSDFGCDYVPMGYLAKATGFSSQKEDN